MTKNQYKTFNMQDHPQQMKIENLKISGLFEIFSYNIPFNKNEQVQIITGPNGYGKTMVLNIIFNLFNRKFTYFQKLSFTEIILTISENNEIVLSKQIEERVTDETDRKRKGIFVSHKLIVQFKKDSKIIETVEYSAKFQSDIERNIRRYLPVAQYDEDRWIDHRNNRILTYDEVMTEYVDMLPGNVTKNLFKIKTPEFNTLLDSIKVHLIKEQRLFKRIPSEETNFNSEREREQTVMIETIQTYSRELKSLMTAYLKRSFTTSQELDSTFPERLINEKEKLTEKEYNIRFTDLKEKQEKLAKFGLYQGQQNFLEYSESDSKALLVYLNDLERKLGVFDDLLYKLQLFSDILNERRFNYKTINIDVNNGFYFKTSKDFILELNQLSSGEQHEVVLLYELIFNTKENILVMIDEPEISLHVNWQKEFLNDLLKIIKLKDTQVIVATHSPSIINGRWDLVYNLGKENDI